jgi:hypothetical protein
MALSKPFKRTARPQADGNYRGQARYIKDPRYAAGREHYIRAFLILQKDLLELFDYVEPSDKTAHVTHTAFMSCIRALA